MTVPLDRHYELELHVSEERVPQIRRIVAAYLRYWNLDPHVQAVCRGVDELLTNVHHHVGGTSRCVLELRLSGRHLTASVTDDGPAMPRLLTAGGGGLARVAALSDSWGTCPTADGKVVWFTRSVQAPVSEPRVRAVPPTPVDTALRAEPAAEAVTAAGEPASRTSRVPEPA
ncbi:ATP-binding protein [Streptomyces tremellae]|uniref:ATP-binding protein n=1 Tax=Streptomyces tremellae TaxID=1124239 RepID=A0ABP7E407_9ACTN